MRHRSHHTATTTLAVSAVVFVAAAACSESATAPKGAVARLELSAPPALLPLDDTVRLHARAVDRDGNDVPGAVVHWSLGSAAAGAVVSVDSGGLVTGRGVGAAAVVASAGAARKAVTVNVGDVPTTVRLAAVDTLLDAGGSAAVSAVVGGRRGALLNAPVAWSTTDPRAVTTGADGVAHAVAEGSAWIVGASGAARDSVQIMVGYHKVANGQRFASLSLFSQAVESGGCALTVGGAAWCWGGSNRWGELGATPSRSPARYDLVAVSGGLTFREIHGGENAACGLTAADGALYCWGRNFTAQFGTGSTQPASSTTPVAGAGALRFRTMSLGANGTACGVSAAADALLYCWGHDAFSTTGKDTAVTVNIDSIVAPVTGSLAAAQVHVFDYHGCAVDAERGAWCWGGSGDNFGLAGPVRAPVRVAPAGTFASVVTGDVATCGLAPDGQAFCWGYGSVAPAPGGAPNVKVVAPTAVAGALRFRKLSISVWDFACGLTLDGDLYCWGDNGAYANSMVGGLGRAGGPAPPSAPVPVLPGRKFVDVSESCAVDVAGDIYCWSQR